jgi:short-subunit dehydrogenase
MKRILIIGATSSIAQAAARLWAARGDRLFLLGRDETRLQAIAADLQVRGAAMAAHARLDANDFDQHANVLDAAGAALGPIDIVLLAYGTLGDQRQCERDARGAREQFDTNATSVLSLLTHLGNRFEMQGHGTIAVISSVAGERGRQSNYVYGAAKSAVTTFAAGLRNRLHHAGVHVLTIKPGFVDTPMTARFEKGPLWAAPETVAECIDRAIAQRRDVVYAPWFWGGIMAVIRMIPERLFKTLRL